MQDYSYLNSLLLKPGGQFQEFEKQLKRIAVEQETYLNLFLVTVVSHKSTSPDFDKYLHLLTHFKEYTGKKSANINYIGYKDRKTILMHACQRGTPRAVQLLLFCKIESEIKDPQGKTAAFYAVNNPNEENSNNILALILNQYPRLVHIEGNDGQTLLLEAIHKLRPTTCEVLLKRGANPNSKLKNNGNTVSHELLNHYQNNREAVLTLLLLMAKFKANFNQPNSEGITVFERAKLEGIDIQNYASFCDLLEKDSVAEEIDNQSDKISLTTFYQFTKANDSASEIIEGDSNPYSGKVDFSQFDDPILQPPQTADLSLESESQSSCELILTDQIDFQLLGSEIYELSYEDIKIHQSMVPLAHRFFIKLSKVINNYGLMIDVVGSFATGLWTPQSDINISLIPISADYINFEQTLEKIYRKLKHSRNQFNIEDIHFTKGKINCIKVSLGGQYHGQAFDIAIFHRNHSNRQYVAFILETLRDYPTIRPLFFVYRRICQQFNLHDPTNGGLKTYTLFLMITSVVKTTHNDDIGVLFYQIALKFGFNFEYGFDDREQEELISAVDFPVMCLNLMDPFNPRNNIGGKNTKASHLENMFRAIWIYLQSSPPGPYLPNLLRLQSLL